MYKESKSMDAHQNRLLTKAHAWNEKALTDMDRSWDNIERDLGKWVANRDKMYPNLSVTYSTDNFKLQDFPSIPAEHIDSLQTMFDRINSNRENWHKFMDRSSLYGIYNAQTKQNEILLENAYFLKTMSFKNNDKLRVNDSIFQLKHEYAEIIYSDSLKLEMYSKDYIQSLNTFYKYVNVVIEDIKSRTEINISDQRATSGMLTGYALEQTKRFLNDLVEANEHFWWLEEELPNVGEFWNKLIKSSENQLVLEEERMEYITTNLEITETREDNLLEMIKLNVKAWKMMMK
jgi:superfamily II DNA helicase RecQ